MTRTNPPSLRRGLDFAFLGDAPWAKLRTGEGEETIDRQDSRREPGEARFRPVAALPARRLGSDAVRHRARAATVARARPAMASRLPEDSGCGFPRWLQVRRRDTKPRPEGRHPGGSKAGGITVAKPQTLDVACFVSGSAYRLGMGAMPSTVPTGSTGVSGCGGDTPSSPWPIHPPRRPRTGPTSPTTPICSRPRKPCRTREARPGSPGRSIARPPVRRVGRTSCPGWMRSCCCSSSGFCRSEPFSDSRPARSLRPPRRRRPRSCG